MAANLLFRRFGRQRKRRVFRERIFHLENMNDEEVRRRYRFGKNNIKIICDILKEKIKPFTARSRAISVEMQVLIALRFYATGSFLQVLGDTVGVDKGTVSRVVRKVSVALAELLPRIVQWPTEEMKSTIKNDFYKMAGFPGVIGCIDGTHIRIQRPSDHEPDFINRKFYPSINVQAVCDSQGKFTNLVARWPGSNHDSFIFNNSHLKTRLEESTALQDGIVLGDSGYACKYYLLTPYLRPSTPAQENYNSAHCRTRVTIERAFGWWKRRFHCLHGEIRMHPERVCTIIGACAVLHNLAILMREPLVDENGEIDMGNINERHDGPEDGQSIRNFITERYFNI